MHIDFKKLREICPQRSKNDNICRELKYYDCSESNCPLNTTNTPAPLATKEL